MSNFWDVVWTAFLIFAFVVYLGILFSVLTDLFRDRELSGWYKAVWILFLVWIPYLTAFVYFIVRGRGMAERQEIATDQNKKFTAHFIREASGISPSVEIERAKKLLDDDVISAEEYAALKAKALA